MGDGWLIIVGILGLILLGLMPSLIARITGRKVQVRTRTGSFIAEPFKTKKERQKEDEQDVLIKELNKFCIDVSYMDFDPYDTDLNLELPNTDGRPMLTTKARRIANTGKVMTAINGYKELNELKKSGAINDDEFKSRAIQLYRFCTTS